MLNHRITVRTLVMLLVGAVGAGLVTSGCSPQNTARTNDATATIVGVARQTPAPSPSAPTATTPPTAAPVTLTASPTPACKPTVELDDVTVPDGSRLKPGEAFVKAWRFLNTGNCAWEKGWALVFQNGERFSAPDTAPISVADVGKSVEVSMTMKAPQSPGTYAGVWAVQMPSGQIVTVADVSIVVFAPTPTRAPTAVAPAAKPTTQAVGGSIPPNGTGGFAVDRGAFGPVNCVRLSESEWMGEFQIIVAGGPGNYTISDPEHCKWDYSIRKFVCHYTSRFDGGVNKELFVSCPGCKPQPVSVSGRSRVALNPFDRDLNGACPVAPGPWGVPGGKDKD